MPVYRMFSTDGANNFVKSERMEAETDEEAIEIVKAQNLSVSWELWNRNRLVAATGPDGAARMRKS